MRSPSHLHLALAAFLLIPPPVAAGELDRLENADLATSERLRLRAYGQALSAGAISPYHLTRMREIMSWQGYYFDDASPARVARQASVTPFIAWDGNINGGVLQDRFVLNDLVFTADPEFRAKSGIVTGLAAGGLLRYAWSSGRFIELRGVAEIGLSPEHEIARGDLALSICSRNHVAGWTFLDVCGAAQQRWRDLGDSFEGQASGTLSRIVSATNSIHEYSLEYVWASDGGLNQHRVAVSSESIWDQAVTELRITFGAPVDNETAVRMRLDAGIGWLALGHRWSVDVWKEHAEGGLFLGTPREDRARGVGLSTNLRSGASLRLGYLERNSTAAIANYEQITFDVRFRDLDWLLEN